MWHRRADAGAADAITLTRVDELSEGAVPPWPRRLIDVERGAVLLGAAPKVSIDVFALPGAGGTWWWRR